MKAYAEMTFDEKLEYCLQWRQEKERDWAEFLEALSSQSFRLPVGYLTSYYFQVSQNVIF